MAEKKEVKLPEKLSDCIILALHDIALVERSKKYRIDMGSWHGPHWTDDALGNEKRVCEVCWAGSVMAKSLNADPEAEMDPYHFSDWNKNRLNALNYVRTGFVGDALECLRGSVPAGVQRYSPTTSYASDKAAWKKDMRSIAASLAKAGL